MSLENREDGLVLKLTNKGKGLACCDFFWCRNKVFLLMRCYNLMDGEKDHILKQKDWNGETTVDSEEF